MASISNPQSSRFAESAEILCEHFLVRCLLGLLSLGSPQENFSQIIFLWETRSTPRITCREVVIWRELWYFFKFWGDYNIDLQQPRVSSDGFWEFTLLSKHISWSKSFFGTILFPQNHKPQLKKKLIFQFLTQKCEKNFSQFFENISFLIFQQNTAKNGKDFILRKKLLFRNFCKKMKFKIWLVTGNCIWPTKIRLEDPLTPQNRHVKCFWLHPKNSCKKSPKQTLPKTDLKWTLPCVAWFCCGLVLFLFFFLMKQKKKHNWVLLSNLRIVSQTYNATCLRRFSCYKPYYVQIIQLKEQSKPSREKNLCIEIQSTGILVRAKFDPICESKTNSRFS